MKKTVLTIMSLMAASTVFAMIFGRFQGWDALITQSPDVVIARCAASSQSQTNMDGVIDSDIEVVSVLKGNTQAGLSHMKSWYFPSQNKRFLMFGSYNQNGTNSSFQAIETFRIIPLNQNFQIAQLDGKPINEQVKLILDSRLKDLNDEITQDNEEKSRIQNNMSSNAPITLKNPSATGSSFHSDK